MSNTAAITVGGVRRLERGRRVVKTSATQIREKTTSDQVERSEPGRACSRSVVGVAVVWVIGCPFVIVMVWRLRR